MKEKDGEDDGEVKEEDADDNGDVKEEDDEDSGYVKEEDDDDHGNVKEDEDDDSGDVKEEEGDNLLPAMPCPDSLPLPRPGNSSKPLSLEYYTPTEYLQYCCCFT